MTSTDISARDRCEPVSTTDVWQRPDERRWFAVYTCAQHEKRVEEQLIQRNIESFLPTYESVRRWTDRRVRLRLPVFPGYVFVRIALSARLTVLQTRSVVRLVSFNGRACPIPECDIDVLRNGIAHALRIEPHPYLAKGSRVRVIRGPLEGAEGILVRKKNIYRVVLSLDFISRSAAVEVEFKDIERISPQAELTRIKHRAEVGAS
jgi:transcription antitermination factor NusG